MATASNVPTVPAGTSPAQPALLARRSQVMAVIRGTPGVSGTGPVEAGARPGGAHALESHMTRPFLVTTTRTADGPYTSSQGPGAVDTA
jgi:hypothetical protein